MNRFNFYFAFFPCFFLLSCFNTMTDQDNKFVEKIKANLKKKGDSVKVSDIHSGEWHSVCFTAYGASDDAVRSVSGIYNIPMNEVIVINRKREEVAHGDDFDWGVFFYYPPNKIEYFEIYRDVMTPGGGEYGCANKEVAQFTASSNYSVKGKVNNYLVIGLAGRD